MSRAEEWQEIFHKYEAENMSIPATTKQIAVWAVEQGLAVPRPPVDPMDQLADECARGLREEYRDDGRGRRYRVNHAVRKMSGGTQMTFWADIETAPREHMVAAFSQRRTQIIGDCFQLKTDVDCFNNLRSTEEQIQMELNFTKDVAEIEAIELEEVGATSSIEPRLQVARLQNAEHP